MDKRSGTALPLTYCDHQWQYEEIDGKTWNVCWDCGFRELWAGGTLVDSSDRVESARLDEFEGLHHA